MDRGKSTPAPIFNHRKRPRQAVIADPQDTNGNDLMPVGGFNGGSKASNTGQGFKRFSSFNSSEVSEKGDHLGQSYQNGKGSNPTQNLQQKTYGNNNQGQGQNLYRQQNSSSSSSSFHQGGFNSYMNPKGAAYGSTQQEKQGSNSNFSSINGGASSYNKMACVGQNRAQQQMGYPSSTVSSHNKQTNYSQQTAGNRNQFGQQMSENQTAGGPNQFGQQMSGNQTAGGPFQQNSRGYTNSNQNSYHGNQNFQPSNRGNQQSNTQSWRNNQQTFRPLQQNRPINQTENSRMFDQRSSNNNRFTSSVQNNGGIPVDNSPARGAVFPSQTKALTTRISENKNRDVKKTTSQSKQKIDPSLHVLTVGISRVMYWSKYKDNINMIFEVFGVLDSAVTRHPSGVCKEFKLRDEQYQMNCVFYEIDRDLPKLIRGHWYRCMGTFDLRNGLFKCVSVRMAAVEERNNCQQQTEATHELLKQMTKHLPEQ